MRKIVNNNVDTPNEVAQDDLNGVPTDVKQARSDEVTESSGESIQMTG